MKKILFLMLFLAPFLFAQQKYLVSPNGSVLQVRSGESSSQVIKNFMDRTTAAVSAICSDKFKFGYTQSMFPTNFCNAAMHKDVIGQWFVAGANGTIDTVFWSNTYCQSTGAIDSLVFVRIHESNLGPDYGPGIGEYAGAPPCQSWGYWINSLDYDQGVAAFPDDATDTTWYSTIHITSLDPSVPPTRPPFGYAKWGALGFGKIHKVGINSVAMLDAGEPCSVKVGNKFFISFRINSGLYHNPDPDEIYTTIDVWATEFPLSSSNDENWPARNWKFYEHDSGVGSCAGGTINKVKRGWVARGPMLTDDILGTTVLNIWYAMTVTTNVPPIINSTAIGDPFNTFSNNDYIVQYEVYDCDPADPEDAGLANVVLSWSKGEINSQGVIMVNQPDITMDPIGGDIWEATIPGQPANTIISYRVFAEDTKGMTQMGASHSFRIYSLKQQYYLVDTGTCGTMYTIKGLGSTTEINYNDFFINTALSGATAPRDDGTAGPFDVGGDMPIFGDVARYAWVGVNGAIALSKSATDTIDVNSNGYWTGSWIFPYPQHPGRSDSINPSWMPPNFISAFWADLIIADTGVAPNKYGHIFYGNADDPCKFIVEYDSIGSFNQDLGVGETDATIFRIVLNRCDGTIEYQYVGVGSRGQDSAALVGLQADSSALSGAEPGWIFVNYYAQPYETKPRPNFCIKFYPGAPVFAQAGWNLLSVANDRVGDMAKTSVYPNAVSDAFKYVGSYQQEATLVNGVGYWLKYDKYTYAGAPGYEKGAVTATVASGWNMIGSITKPVPTASIVKTPSGIVVSDYFKYEGGYQTVTTLEPGLGFWVKTDMAGTLDLTAPESMPKQVAADYSQMNRITVTDRLGRMQKLYVGEESVMKAQSMYTGEMPPAAPEFDVRFVSTGGMVVSHPAKVEDRLEYEIRVTTDAYPITIMWGVVEPMTLYAGGRVVNVMEGSGALQLKSSAGLAVGIGSGVSVPKVFALGQNYPNPFNPVTHFTVDVPRLADVELAVYNVLGQKVKTLLSGETTPGSYEMEWDGTDGQGVPVPTGIYFIRMSTDGFKAAQKVMLMK